MPLTAYVCRDVNRRRRHSESVPFSPQVPAGAYVYVQDCAGVVWVLPDGVHQHPHVLGGRRPAVAAGELTLGIDGEVLSINNISGTYRCATDCLLAAVGALVKQGAKVSADAFTPYEE